MGNPHPSLYLSLSLSHVYTHAHAGDDKIILFVLIVTDDCEVCPLASRWVITVMKQRQKTLSQDLLRFSYSDTERVYGTKQSTVQTK